MKFGLKSFIAGVLATTVVFSAGVVTASNSTLFTDVNTNEWFADSADRVATAKVFSGYPDGTFQGNKPVTRAELAKVIENLAEQGYIVLPETEEQYNAYQQYVTEFHNPFLEAIYSGELFIEWEE